MTGMVLALAGLTCGDGGPGIGAATAPVAVDPSGGEWEGERYAPFVPFQLRVRLRQGLLCFDDPDSVGPLAFQPDGMIVCGGKLWGGYARKGGRLVILIDETRSYLRPVVPRKP